MRARRLGPHSFFPALGRHRRRGGGKRGTEETREKKKEKTRSKKKGKRSFSFLPYLTFSFFLLLCAKLSFSRPRCALFAGVVVLSVRGCRKGKTNERERARAGKRPEKTRKAMAPVIPLAAATAASAIALLFSLSHRFSSLSNDSAPIHNTNRRSRTTQPNGEK